MSTQENDGDSHEAICFDTEDYLSLSLLLSLSPLSLSLISLALSPLSLSLSLSSPIDMREMGNAWEARVGSVKF